MKSVGLRFYTLFNILAICALGMILIGIISLKITERFAVQGKIDNTKSIITAFELTYYKFNRLDEGIMFLENSLESGSWGFLLDNNKTYEFRTPRAKFIKAIFPNSINRVNGTRKTEIQIDGSTLLPLATYEALKLTIPINSRYGQGVVFIYQPLDSFKENIKLSQKLLTAWVVLFILVIAIFGYYLLSKTVVKPVQNLINVTKEIARGFFPKDIESGNITEINQLHKALSTMYQEIEEAKSNLEENIVELEIANKNLINTQKQLIATEKMASLGKLSAGVAHEIGNPISAINGYVEILKKDINIDNARRNQYLDKIENEIDRVNNIIKTLLDYSRHKEPVIKDVDVNNVIQVAIDFVKNQGILDDIKIDLKLYKGNLFIKADPNQIIQVIINLILNSKDALNGIGKIEISSNLINKNKIEITVKDNGEGISADKIEKIFDPFYTTKEPGKGTGLGLSISERIVQQFDGKILVDSKIGEGTEFKLIFPRLEQEVIHAESIVS